MSKIVIGHAGRHGVGFDIPQLLVSRLLVQASSGGGKSFLLRRMMEQGFGKVQQIVIDPAGEFATLREKFGFVLVGEHGETPADIRSAGLVAEKLLELRASAVCDLYSLKPLERHTWVQRFLTAVMNSPKKLWHPVLFYVDEAHKFCPEKGEGESEAKEMMLSLGSDGRKYGFCMIPATQRLAKLDKSLASELHNVLIGPTWIDIDLQRAHKALGIIQRDQAAFNEQMKILKPGHFWALGRAISTTRVLVKIGSIQTTHPTAGSGKYSAEPPPPPEKVKALLPKLADLPQEAETKARTEAEFRREIRELKQKLTAAAKSQAPSPSSSLPAQAKVDLERIKREIARAVTVATKQRDASWSTAVRTFQREIERRIAEGMKQLAGQVHTVPFQAPDAAKIEMPAVASLPVTAPAIAKVQRMSPPPRLIGNSSFTPAPPRETGTNGSAPKMGELHKKIAAILAAHYPDPVDKALLASMCGKTLGGGWNGRLSEVSSLGLLEYVKKTSVRATQECAQQYAGLWDMPRDTEEAIAVWAHKLSDRHRLMLNRLIEADGEPVPKAELAEVAGMTLGGGFNGRLSELCSTGLALYGADKKSAKANKQALFLEAPDRRLAQ